MSDFSLFSLFTAGLACMIPLTAAYTKPTGDAPVGNPISQPGLNSVVPAGKDFTITWQPTTKGSVTLVLLKGPSSNAVPQYPIVEATENDGVYVWHVSEDLAPTDNAQGYGIQLIDDATGQYQYTTQFGISNPDYKKGSESSSAKAPTYGSSSTASAPAYGSSSASKSAPAYGSATTQAPVYTTQFVTDYTTYCPEATSFMGPNNKTYTVTKATTLTIKDCSCTVTKPAQSTSAPVKTAPGPVVPPKGTGYPVMSSPAKNVTMVAPTGYAPSTLKTSSAPTYNAPSQPAASATGPNAAASTGGAASNMVGFGGLILAGAAAVLAM